MTRKNNILSIKTTLIFSLILIFLLNILNSYTIKEDDKPIIDKKISEELKVKEKIRVIISYNEDSVQSRELLVNDLFNDGVRNIRKSKSGANWLSTEISSNDLKRLSNDSRIAGIVIPTIKKTQLGQSAPLINADDVWNLGYNGSGTLSDSKNLTIMI